MKDAGHGGLAPLQGLGALSQHPRMSRTLLVKGGLGVNLPGKKGHTQRRERRTHLRDAVEAGEAHSMCLGAW